MGGYDYTPLIYVRLPGSSRSRSDRVSPLIANFQFPLVDFASRCCAGGKRWRVRANTWAMASAFPAARRLAIQASAVQSPALGFLFLVWPPSAVRREGASLPGQTPWPWQISSQRRRRSARPARESTTPGIEPQTPGWRAAAPPATPDATQRNRERTPTRRTRHKKTERCAFKLGFP